MNRKSTWKHFILVAHSDRARLFWPGFPRDTTQPDSTEPGARLHGRFNCSVGSKHDYSQVLWFSFYPSRIWQQRSVTIQLFTDDVSCFCLCNCFLSIRVLCFARLSFPSIPDKRLKSCHFLIVVILSGVLRPQTKTNPGPVAPFVCLSGFKIVGFQARFSETNLMRK